MQGTPARPGMCTLLRGLDAPLLRTPNNGAREILKSAANGRAMAVHDPMRRRSRTMAGIEPGRTSGCPCVRRSSARFTPPFPMRLRMGDKKHGCW